MHSSTLSTALLALVLVCSMPARAGAQGGAVVPALGTIDLEASGEPGGASTITSGARDATGAARELAAEYPAERRAEVEQLFQTLLAQYPRIEAQLGVPAGDASAALALFIVAAYEAARGTEVAQTLYAAILAQMRGALARNAAFARATPAARRAIYERLAILGMYVAVTRAGLASQPNPAAERSLREAGAGYLAALGLDAARMQFGPRGITVSGEGGARGGAPRDEGREPTGTAEAPRGPAAPAAPAAPARPGFRYMAAPGKGLGSGAIAAVVYSWQQVYRITGLDLVERTYLLLADGSVRDGVPPVPPEDFDAAAERRAEPARWGTWRKAGKGYEVRIGDATSFATPPGQLVRSPGKKDEVLDGSFVTSSSYSIPGGAGSWSKSTVRFGRDHRFSMSRAGGVGGSTGYGDQQITTLGLHDDDGSVSSVAGPNFGGGSTRTRPSTKTDREGTYRIDGYTLELRYDSGRVERRFFFVSTDRKHVWFGDVELMDERALRSR